MVLTRINNNVSAFNAARNLNQTSQQLGKSLERLSSGLRINRAADDAAGLSISESQRAQIRGLSRAIQNAQDATSLINTAEGALNETTVRLQRIRELAVQASNTGGNDAAAIQAAQDEIEQSIAEINRIAETTQFGTRKILSGNFAASATIVTGATAGVSIASSPVASTLEAGTHTVTVTQTVTGSQTLASGADGVNNSNATAITNSTFDTGTYNLVVSNAAATTAQVLDTSAVTVGAQAQVLDTSEFTGGGAATGGAALTGLNFDGANALSYNDTITITGVDADGNAVSGVFTVDSGSTVNDLVTAISAAYSGATASLAADGSIRLTDAAVGTSTSTLTLTVAGGVAVTDSAAVLTTGLDGTAAVTTTALTGAAYLGNLLAVNDTITYTGVDASGNAVSGVFTVDSGSTLANLLSGISAAYGGATATLDTDGSILLTDDTGGASSSTTLTLTLGGAASGNEAASVTTTGADGGSSASVSLGGGATVTVNSGETVTLYGATGADGITPELTLTFGNLSNGTDTISVVQSEFTATLDGGNAVTFQNGDQNVRLIGGTDGGFTAGQSLQLNFGADLAAGTASVTATDDSLVFQIGANRGQTINVALSDLGADQLGFASQTGRSVADVNVTTFSGAQDAITVIDEALSQVSQVRSRLGAFSNRLDSTIANLGVAQENLTASESRIRDADIAFETTQFTRNQILVQAGVSILAQANIAPQSVLQLLG